MIKTFTSSNSGNVPASPFASARLVARSSYSGDTSQTLTVSGLDGSSSVSDSVALNGQVESVLPDETFTQVLSVSLDAAHAGTVKIHTEGTPGEGVLFLTAQPSNGDTVTIGLTAPEQQTYTYVSSATVSFLCNLDAAFAQGAYFDITAGATTHRYWYSIALSDVNKPSVVGVTEHRLDVATGSAVETRRQITSAAVNATSGINCNVFEAGVIYVNNEINVSLDVAGATLTVTNGTNTAINTITVVSAGGTLAEDQVAIGTTVAISQTNLVAAINKTTEGSGTLYGAATAENPYVSAAEANGIGTLTDKIGCDRATSWACSRSGTAVSISNLTGGLDGALVATLSPEALSSYSSVSLDDESLSAKALPGSTVWVSNAVQVAGKPFTLYLAAETATSALACKLQYSTDLSGLVWFDGPEDIDDLTGGTAARQIVASANLSEYIRLHITNTNAAAVSVNAKVCYG